MIIQSVNQKTNRRYVFAKTIGDISLHGHFTYIRIKWNNERTLGHTAHTYINVEAHTHHEPRSRSKLTLQSSD